MIFRVTGRKLFPHKYCNIEFPCLVERFESNDYRNVLQKRITIEHSKRTVLRTLHIGLFQVFLHELPFGEDKPNKKPNSRKLFSPPNGTSKSIYRIWQFMVGQLCIWKILWLASTRSLGFDNMIVKKLIFQMTLCFHSWPFRAIGGAEMEVLVAFFLR